MPRPAPLGLLCRQQTGSAHAAQPALRRQRLRQSSLAWTPGATARRPDPSGACPPASRVQPPPAAWARPRLGCRRRPGQGTRASGVTLQPWLVFPAESFPALPERRSGGSLSLDVGQPGPHGSLLPLSLCHAPAGAVGLQGGWGARPSSPEAGALLRAGGGPLVRHDELWDCRLAGGALGSAGADRRLGAGSRTAVTRADPRPDGSPAVLCRVGQGGRPALAGV